MPYTSFSTNVAPSKSRFCTSLGFKIIRFLPSMIFCVCWHESMPKNTSGCGQICAWLIVGELGEPSTGLQSHAAVTF